MNKSAVREVVVGLGIGLLTNVIWTAVSDQTNIYIVTLIFALAILLYYIAWQFIIKPLILNRRMRVREVYSNYSQAKPAIKNTLKESSNIKVMSVGGSSLTEEDRGEMLDLLSKRILARAKVKILLLNPNSHAVKARFDELDRLKSINNESQELSRHIFVSAQKILSRNNEIELRYYDSKPIWRLYIFDKIAFISFYLGDKEGHNTEVIVLERGSDLFSAIERNFDSLWDVGQATGIASSAQLVTP